MKLINRPLDPERIFVTGAGGVRFGLHVDGRSLSCYATRAVLEAYFGADADADACESDACLQAFDDHAELIQRLAREQWLRRGAGIPAVVLTVDAVFRALTWN